MIARETVFAALFAKGAAASWTDPETGAPATFLYSARRVVTWDRVPAQPSLCQAEHDEMFQQATDMPGMVTLSATWLVYHTAGKDNSATVPASTSNAIMDALQAALKPIGVTKQSLGGLVHHCWIAGRVFRANGDIDGQALISVPIKILIPAS